MKNNTKVRLHLSKQLFESLAKQVLAEAKKGDMSGGAYTEAVKAPKTSKAPKAPKAEKEVKEMETMTAEAPMKKDKEQVKEFAEPIQQLFSDPETFQSFLKSLAVLGTSGAAIAGLIKVGVKKMASKLKKDPKYAGKSDQEIEKMIGQELTGKVQQTAGGSGEGGLLGK
jgi:hypothetical protein